MAPPRATEVGRSTVTFWKTSVEEFLGGLEPIRRSSSSANAKTTPAIPVTVPGLNHGRGHGEMMSYALPAFPRRLTIGLFNQAASPAYERLFAAFGRMFPLEFVPAAPRGGAVLDGAVVFDTGGMADKRPEPLGVPAYVASDKPAGRVARNSWGVKFGSSPNLNLCLRGRSWKMWNCAVFCPCRQAPAMKCWLHPTGNRFGFCAEMAPDRFIGLALCPLRCRRTSTYGSTSGQVVLSGCCL